MLVRSSSFFCILCYEYVSLGSKPIKLKVAPVAAVKKETPSEDFSSWGQESATSTVDQENICECSLYLLRSMTPWQRLTCHPREISSDPKKLKERKNPCRNTFCLEHFSKKHPTINASSSERPNANNLFSIYLWCTSTDFSIYRRRRFRLRRYVCPFSQHEVPRLGYQWYCTWRDGLRSCQC